ncbi:di-heme oxidoreductase family protein [Pseudodonghicola flavimaris]|uniref:Di-heme oxidoredictase family protein n=1 Tax=Pseudodonghicola flavimaris TaxID=3050036 RepID=A0ABT7F4G1_9RHOB|nr:di-heme oxidoredictase family protein [Pseudodonghicola flavimaris]MDK3019487.1 di-heme oxidoredictase family protein [Pseudodonghicola flavimaris]
MTVLAQKNTRNSTPRKWTRASNPIAVLALVLVAGAGQADPLPPLTEPHLTSVPRQAAEAARVRAVTAPATGFAAAEAFEDRPAGAATVLKADKDAFAQPSANMAFESLLDFRLGHGMFEKLWVSSPSSTLASDGLGPLYNARACLSCHPRDGRGHPPAAGEAALSLVLHLARPVGVAGDPALAAVPGFQPTAPDPTYGRQLQNRAVVGLAPEYRLGLSYDRIEIPLAGGESATLHAPRYRLEELSAGPLAPDTAWSPRVAPAMIGLGLLEAIPATDILAHADPEDADGDGISGRANIVWSEVYRRPMLGRFGLKAGQPTVAEQSAHAFSDDIGISTPLFPAAWGDCTAAQPECRGAPHGDGDARGQEIDAEAFGKLVYYSRNLAVPARRDSGTPEVLRGKQVFYDTGCPACHVPKFVTHRLEDRPEQSFQLIWPYSDMLLHDMGPGLADDLVEGRATGAEWRTAPLWGIGLTRTVEPRAGFLHDGRARSLLEAILWHGGEAQPHRDRVIALSPADRSALVRFLESL